MSPPRLSSSGSERNAPDNVRDITPLSLLIDCSVPSGIPSTESLATIWWDSKMAEITAHVVTAYDSLQEVAGGVSKTSGSGAFQSALRALCLALVSLDIDNLALELLVNEP
jgi:hypothetical protein